MKFLWQHERYSLYVQVPISGTLASKRKSSLYSKCKIKIMFLAPGGIVPLLAINESTQVELISVQCNVQAYNNGPMYYIALYRCMLITIRPDINRNTKRSTATALLAAVIVFFLFTKYNIV